MIFLSDTIKSFFRDISRESILILTTFTFDEIALKVLLDHHQVPSRQKIIVYYEIMKHRNPGYIRNYYTNVTTIAINLKTSQTSGCPIFHAKLWAVVNEKPFKVNRLAIHSFNLSRFHLDGSAERAKTYEAIEIWDNVKLGQREGTLFDRQYLNLKPEQYRRNIKPSTIFVDGLKQPATIEFLDSTVEKVVTTNIDNLKEQLTACAAPFIHRSPITRLTNRNAESRQRLSIWTGTRRDSTRLHLKILDLQRHVFLGSANLTKQAFGMVDSKNKILNYECLGLIAKPKPFKLSKQLKGFTKLKYNELDTDSEAEPEEDPDDLDGDWQRQKNEAVAAPLRIFVHNRRGSDVELRIIGSIDKSATHIAICNYDITTNLTETCVQLPFTRFSRHNNLLIAKITSGHEAEQFLKTILQPPVIVKGLLKGVVLWQCELDLNVFWKWLDKNEPRIKILINSIGGARRGSEDNKIKYCRFEDVRNHRAQIYYELVSLKGSESRKVQQWNDWVNKVSHQSKGIPNWCRKIVEKISLVRFGSSLS